MINLRLALAALAALLLAPATAALAQEEANGITIELNKLEPQEGACRAYLVFKNATKESFDGFTLDLYIFGTDGTITKRLAVNGAPLPVEKTRVALFDIRDVTCESMSHILINDVIKCQDGSGERKDCVTLIETSSRSETSFFK